VIIRPAGADLLCIRQPDHAALAARIAASWCADGLPDRPTHPLVLRATARHDIGWEDEDAAPRVDPATGHPFDFIGSPLEVRQRLWPRAVARLATDDAYVAALVAQHALTVYRRFERDPAWRAFFADLERRRDDLVVEAAAPGAGTAGRAPVDIRGFLADYTIVGLCDLFSLIFCSGWREPYLMEGYTAILVGDRLTVSPDPFGGLAVPLAVTARRIRARRHESDADLRAALEAAPATVLTGVAIGGPAPIS
jgi:hypothetical protein